jgi:hypothetical protein
MKKGVTRKPGDDGPIFFSGFIFFRPFSATEDPGSRFSGKSTRFTQPLAADGTRIPSNPAVKTARAIGRGSDKNPLLQTGDVGDDTVELTGHQQIQRA